MNDVEARITDYLSGGGLFNPELANHYAVCDLIIDLRAELAMANQALTQISKMPDEDDERDAVDKYHAVIDYAKRALAKPADKEVKK